MIADTTLQGCLLSVHMSASRVLEYILATNSFINQVYGSTSRDLLLDLDWQKDRFKKRNGYQRLGDQGLFTHLKFFLFRIETKKSWPPNRGFFSIFNWHLVFAKTVSILFFDGIPCSEPIYSINSGDCWSNFHPFS